MTTARHFFYGSRAKKGEGKRTFFRKGLGPRLVP